MSRMGNIPVALPAAVKLEQDGQTVKVTGPKGSLTVPLPDCIQMENKDGKVHLTRKDETKRSNVLHGTTRSLLNGAVIGVTEGYKRQLELVGVGYRASVAGQKMTLNLGYSNPVEYQIPEGIKATMTDPTHITLEGIDKQLIGQVAANIRSFRVPDSYHGKGVRYQGEQITLKEGKRA